jgi:hypothetical protein
MVLRFLPGFLLILVVSTASAQSVPTDNDLFAAYCMGSKQRRLETQRNYQEKCRWGADQRACYATRLGLKQDEERWTRVRDYLLVKGYLSNGLIVDTQKALILASRNGYKDTAECEVWIEENTQLSIDRCWKGQSDDAFTACIMRVQPPVCHQQHRCDDLTRLPM